QLLEARLGIEIHNAGINGDTLEGMLLRLETDVLPYHPRICIVMGGTNDVFTGFGLQSLQETVQTLDQALRENDVIPVHGLPVPILLSNLAPPLAEYRAWLSGWAENCIPFDAALTDPDGRILAGRLPDGVHPDDDGYELIDRKSTRLNSSHVKS